MGCNKSKYLIIFTLIFLIILPDLLCGQSWRNRRKKNGIWDNWSVNLNIGQTSFFGDVSIFDDNIDEKLSKESDLAYGLIISKKIHPIFTLGGQLLFGSLKGQNTGSCFKADIIEYTLNGTINFINLLLPDNNAKFYLIGILGVGQFNFKSKLVYFDPSLEDQIEDTGTPEFVYLFGAGFYYIINENFNLTGDMAIRQARNDKLDVSSNNKDMDYYTYISIGLSYKINNKSKSGRSSRGRLPMRRRR
ncbi:MAG: porin family protein [Bacteroidales bacterium]|nr:porin family protein [Bacteroidales bacterium]